MKKHTLFPVGNGRKVCTALLLGGVGIVGANAQDLKENSTTDESGNHISIVKTSQDTTVYKILEKDRPGSLNDIPVPHFAIHTQNNNFVMTIGAQINPIIGVDMGSNLYRQDNAGSSFVPSAIPVPAPAGGKSDFFINAFNANFDFQVVGFGGTDNQITGYLKFGTNGNNNNMRLKKAFLTWRGLSAGYKTSLFTDGDSSPATIDPQGPNGMVSTTVNEISYESPSFGGFTFAAGVDMPSYYSSQGYYLGKDYQSWQGTPIAGAQVVDPTYYSMTVPDIPLYVQYTDNKYVRVKLAGLIRTKFYRDILDQKKRTTMGWGLSLTGNIMPTDALTIYLQGNYGQGIGAYIQDLAGLPLSYVPDDSKPGKMKAAPMMGWLAGLTYNFNKQWQTNLMFSQARIWDVSPYATHDADSTNSNVNNYKYGLYTAANVFYNISSYFSVGIEYLYGYRKTWNAGSGHDNRLQMQLEFTL
ncbi:MAG: porin [Muribaculaceae bacterium]|nr:porin [Muribaculaceae bacterium]